MEHPLKTHLLDSGALNSRDLAKLERIREEQLEGETLVSLLLRLGMVADDALVLALAAVTGLSVADTGDLPAAPLFAEELALRFLREQLALPLTQRGGELVVAVVDPGNAYLLAALTLATGLEVRPVLAPRPLILSALDRLYAPEGEAPAEQHHDLSDTDVAQLRDMASEAPVIRLVNQVLQRAINERASDIHIEPFENRLLVRLRVDGVLRQEADYPLAMAAAVISRVKIMAHLDIAERRLPQDGRINLRLQGRDLDIRVSTTPTMFGESLVLRLLHRETVALDFDSLGFDAAHKQTLREALAVPHGMVVVTGPTGSGKTTTLYTALNSLNTVERKVITVEDPVEYNLEGINQIQVNPAIGLTFAGALRAIVRQDPDVIMVGEMRDLETARICVQSSLTGHLVLSTLHTNDAAGSITRLMDMGVEPYLLNSTLNLVLAQRLVRLLCPECRQPHAPEPQQVRDFGLDRLSDGAAIVLHRAVGCAACQGIGYRGRSAIVELLPMSDHIRELVSQRAGAGAIERAAVAEGMRTMFEDGCRKALAGLTTLDEVVRVSQEL